MIIILICHCLTLCISHLCSCLDSSHFKTKIDAVRNFAWRMRIISRAIEWATIKQLSWPTEEREAKPAPIFSCAQFWFLLRLRTHSLRSKTPTKCSVCRWSSVYLRGGGTGLFEDFSFWESQGTWTCKLCFCSLNIKWNASALHTGCCQLPLNLCHLQCYRIYSTQDFLENAVEQEGLVCHACRVFV